MKTSYEIKQPVHGETGDGSERIVFDLPAGDLDAADECVVAHLVSIGLATEIKPKAAGKPSEKKE